MFKVLLQEHLKKRYIFC